MAAVGWGSAQMTRRSTMCGCSAAVNHAMLLPLRARQFPVGEARLAPQA